MGALEATPRAFGSALEAVWTRLERLWGVQERPREPEMDAKSVQILAEKDSVTISDLISCFTYFLIVFRGSPLQ